MLKKKTVKKTVKPVKEKIVKVEDEKISDEKKRNDLIAEIAPKLLTKTQLRQGGAAIRSRHMLEKGYETSMVEINELGKKLGLKPIGLGHLRKD